MGRSPVLIVMLTHKPKRREFGRRKSQLKATVYFPGRGSFPCRIRNIGLGGAFLEFSERIVEAPSKFKMTVDGYDETFVCAKRHLSDDGVGVAFMSGDVRPLMFGDLIDTADLCVEPVYYVERPVEPSKKPSAHAQALEFRARRKSGTDTF